MKLRQITVTTVYKSKYSYLDDELISMSELFWRVLRSYKWKCQYQRVNFLLSSGKDKINELPTIYEKELNFDFKVYEECSEIDRKKIIINLIFFEMTILAIGHSCDVATLKEVYEECNNVNYNNVWDFQNKFFRSPDHSLFLKVICNWKSKRLFVFVKVYDSKKEYLFTINWFSINTRIGDIIYTCKGKWLDGNKFCLVSKYDSTEWVIDIPAYPLVPTEKDKE